MRNVILLVSAALLAVAVDSCKEQVNVGETGPVSFNVPVKNFRDINYPSLILKKVLLDPFPTSFVGKSYVCDKKILFVDKNLCWIFEFDSSGRYIGRHIGKGNGKDELPIKKVGFFAPTGDGGYLIIGNSWDCFVFDKDFHRIDDFEINWHPSGMNADKIQHPDASKTDVYTLAYSFSEICIDNSMIYLPLFAQARTFNPTSPAYASEARVLATMDIRDGYISRIMGRLSPVYEEDTNIQTINYLNFDLAPGNKMYLSFPADSAIYVSDRKFSIRRKFGSRGHDMNMNYTPVDNLMNFWKTWHRQNVELGHYNSIKYIPERDLLFRSYQKGLPAGSDGLQIYKNDTLVADVDVPKGFEVTGYIKPYFYSNSFINEETGVITIYKFSID